GHALEQRALARAVLADETEGLALLHLEGDVAQGPELLERSPPAPHQRDLQRLVALVVEPEALRDLLDRDGDVAGHSSSARRGSRAEKTAMPSATVTMEPTRRQMTPIAPGTRRPR